jgi:hypothetical protein
VQEQNLLRQYDLLLNCIEIGLEKGIEAFDKYTLWSLNAAAVANISQAGGRYRGEPVLVGNHRPPHFRLVPDEMDRFSHSFMKVGRFTMTLLRCQLTRCGGSTGFIPLSKGTAERPERLATISYVCAKVAY